MMDQGDAKRTEIGTGQPPGDSISVTAQNSIWWRSKPRHADIREADTKIVAADAPHDNALVGDRAVTLRSRQCVAES